MRDALYVGVVVLCVTRFYVVGSHMKHICIHFVGFQCSLKTHWPPGPTSNHTIVPTKVT